LPYSNNIWIISIPALLDDECVHMKVTELFDLVGIGREGIYPLSSSI